MRLLNKMFAILYDVSCDILKYHGVIPPGLVTSEMTAEMD